MLKNASFSTLTAVALVLSLGACGGGGGGSSTPPSSSAPPPPPPPPPPPSSKTVSTVGVVTGFGSVFINGVKYEVENDTIVSIEGEPEVTGDDSALRVGMRLSAIATETSGVRKADRIDFDEDLRGPAENIVLDSADPTVGTFEVVGQTVIVDSNTIFDNSIGNNDGLAGIDIRDLDPAVLPGAQPMVVEVSGYPTETGTLATRVERENVVAADIGRPGVDGDEIEVKGFVDDVATDGSSLTINGAVFLIDASTQFEAGLSATSDIIGLFVEVKADIDGLGDFVARRVELEDDFSNGQRTGEFEIEGTLQSVNTIDTPNVIVINGITVEVDDASSLLLLVGKRVEIKGAFDGNGVLVLSQANIEQENSVRIEDRVAGIDSASGQITMRLGVIIEPTGASGIRDKTSNDGDSLSPATFLSRLAVNDYLEAQGIPDGNGGVVWTRIERDSETDQDCRLRGPVGAGSIADPEFTILNVVTDTTGLGFGGFEDENDVDIGRSAFFTRLQAGDVVQSKSDDAGLGCTTGRLLTMADGEVEFEPEDGIIGNTDGGQTGGNNGGAAELAGAVRNLDPATNTFSVAGQTVTVTDDTLIDASIVEAARGVELGDADLRFGDLPETLDQLLSNGDLVKVRVDANGNAVLIEDNA